MSAVTILVGQTSPTATIPSPEIHHHQPSPSSHANVNEIKDMFSAGCLVWDVFIPKKPDSGYNFFFIARTAFRVVPKKIYTAGSQVALKDGKFALCCLHFLDILFFCLPSIIDGLLKDS
ncbi:hypothetical protein L1987_24221 [Smallanthus sonchifolius]|uniref:Uncharacterized protein n=1 Tax=Smallanthus sonchifolius TaxID=185202 RepID=A0ACB9IMG7_9ASTR|nr:hypothetical protein L1987_24221 [Smallanthus sonchifolius]